MAKNKEKFYITTSIPYVNAEPHIGHALEFIQADVVARQKRQEGDDVFFLTGADENSLKNVQAAEKEGITTRELVDRNSARIADLAKRLNVSNDDFIRTVEEKHFKGVQKLWSACKPEDIYKKKYKGLYCVGCEQFYKEDELTDGKCPDHQTKPDVVEEENYFFKLSNYQKELERLIESDKYQIVPESRKNEVLSFIKGGLEDFSISRSKERAKNWGVPVPGDDSQVMYVWFDALGNYITALDYNKDGAKFKKYWPADVHAVGKGIIRFHAVYWPALLLSIGLPLPKKLFVHGYFTIDGIKISKSLGNTIDPFELIEKYGADPVRFYFLRHTHPVLDSDFTIESFERAYTADLANGLGNLVSRVSGLIEQNGVRVEIDNNGKAGDKIVKALEEFKFDEALKVVWGLIDDLNKLIDNKKPWELAKADKTDELTAVLSQAVSGLVEVAELLVPFLPETAEKIKKIFTAKKIKKSEALFPRLEEKN